MKKIIHLSQLYPVLTALCLIQSAGNAVSSGYDYNQGERSFNEQVARAIEASIAENEAAIKEERKYQRELEEARAASLLESVQVDIISALGTQATEQFYGGPFPAVRILVPEQASAISCGLHALANLHTVQTLLPSENELRMAGQSAHSFITTSQMTSNALEQYYGCPQEQLELVSLLEYSHSSEFAIRNLYAFAYDDRRRQLRQVYGGGDVGSPYYDAIVPTFKNSVKKLFRPDNDLSIINILLQAGESLESGHWTAVSIIKTASMQMPILIFMDSIGNRPTTTTAKQYKEALQAIQRKIMNDAR